MTAFGLKLAFAFLIKFNLKNVPLLMENNTIKCFLFNEFVKIILYFVNYSKNTANK